MSVAAFFFLMIGLAVSLSVSESFSCALAEGLLGVVESNNPSVNKTVTGVPEPV